MHGNGNELPRNTIHFFLLLLLLFFRSVPLSSARFFIIFTTCVLWCYDFMSLQVVYIASIYSCDRHCRQGRWCWCDFSSFLFLSEIFRFLRVCFGWACAYHKSVWCFALIVIGHVGDFWLCGGETICNRRASPEVKSEMATERVFACRK